MNVRRDDVIVVACAIAIFLAGVVVGRSYAATPRNAPAIAPAHSEAPRERFATYGAGASPAPTVPVQSAGPAQSVSGYATWYSVGSGIYAAAGPALRNALGPGWRGRYVLVCSGPRCVRVKLIDWCACGERHGQPTVIDLSRDAFEVLARASRGVIAVAVRGIE